jgi:DNA polymerase III delta prime subunit
MGVEMDERRRLELIEEVGEAEYRLLQGGSDEVQLNSLLAKIVLVCRGGGAP